MFEFDLTTFVVFVKFYCLIFIITKINNIFNVFFVFIEVSNVNRIIIIFKKFVDRFFKIFEFVVFFSQQQQRH